MKPEEIEKVAELLESTWSNSFYKKDHKALTGSLWILLSDVPCKKVLDILKDYANNYDNVPTVATISKLAHKEESAKRFEKPKEKYIPPRYFEDSDGYGYMKDETGGYVCIWKPWFLDKGYTKMETLKKYGLINY